MAAGLRIDLYRSGDGYRWRLWSNSRIIGGSTEPYGRQRDAISNMETVTGGSFQRISTPDYPKPYGLLHRDARAVSPHGWLLTYQNIPVRLVTS